MENIVRDNATVVFHSACILLLPCRSFWGVSRVAKGAKPLFIRTIADLLWMSAGRKQKSIMRHSAPRVLSCIEIEIMLLDNSNVEYTNVVGFYCKKGVLALNKRLTPIL